MAAHKLACYPIFLFYLNILVKQEVPFVSRISHYSSIKESAIKHYGDFFRDNYKCWRYAALSSVLLILRGSPLWASYSPHC